MIMRTWTLLASIAVFLFTSVNVRSAEQPVSLKINAFLAGDSFAYDQVSTDPTESYGYRLTDLRYYVSQIALIQNDGSTIELEDLYLLVDLGNSDQTYDLGSWDVGAVKSMRFSIGVDQAHNHLDPTTYPPTHPLSPQLPTMHWGWSAGYRFCTLEGYAGPVEGTPSTKFEVHSVGDALYKTIMMDVATDEASNGLTLMIDAEYGNLLDGIEANWGPISHGGTGESATLMENFTKNVFTTPVVTSVSEQPVAGLTLAPNPVIDVMKISTETPDPVQWTLVSITGQTVLQGTVFEGCGSASFSTLPAGTYTLIARGTDGTVSTRMVSIVR
jgi:hypothetical protein